MASPWDAALRYLGQRDHSEHELRTKLARRDFDEDEIENVIQRLYAAKLIDDAKFASACAISYFHSGLSRRAVAIKLRNKGLSDVNIEAALSGLDDDDELGRAIDLARSRLQKMSGIPQATARRRLLAFLGRRGFSESMCYAAVGKAFDEQSNSC